MELSPFVGASIKAHIQRLLSAPTVRVVSRVSGGNLAAMGIAIIGTLVQSRYVGPDDLGYLRQFGIVTSYAFFLHLGLWHALQRRYPLYIGQGRRDEALAVAEICQSWNVSVAVLAAAIFTALTVGALLFGNWRAALAWLVQAVAMGSSLYGGYLGATYRSGHDFETAAKSSVISAGSGLLSLPLLLFWPYVGLVLRSSLPSLASLMYLHVRRPLRLLWRFNGREWWRLLKEGLPIFTASYGAGVGWAAVEMSLVLRYLGARSLGLWVASVMLLEAVNKVSKAITAIYAPRLTEHFGRNASVRGCLRLCLRPMLWGGIGMTAFALGCCPAIPIALKWVLPKYTEAAVPMCLMMLNLPLIVLEMPYSLLIAMGRLLQQNIAVYAGLASFTVLALVSVHLGYGLNGIVMASIIGRLCKMVLSYAYIFAAIRKERLNPQVVA
jgi:O-antigen/teichoic acid export membrane protein